MIAQLAAMATVLTLIGSSCTPPVDPEQPSFDDFLPDRNSLFVAYTSPDPVYKPDSIIISFNYHHIEFSALTVHGTVDSGRTWNSIAPIDAIGTETAEALWLPRSTLPVFLYCGKRECTIKLTDTISGATFTSDPFGIIGALPLQLESPAAHNTFSRSDTISLHYVVNTDLISNVQVFYILPGMDAWREITGTTDRLSIDPPVRQMQTRFIAALFVPAGAESPLPLRFLLRDYQSADPASTIISDTIMMQP